MIEKLQKVFHTDKWWGRVIFIILTYTVFWCVFYGLVLLIPYEFFVGRKGISYFILLYSVIIVPLLSFYLISMVRKVFFIKHFYLLNTLLIILSFILFFYINFLQSVSHWFSF